MPLITPTTLLPPAIFSDYDDPNILLMAQEQAAAEESRNFVVEFGKARSRIAFDFDAESFATLLENGDESERGSGRSGEEDELAVRWINIWAPHRQDDLVRLLGTRYRFSPRLLAIICSRPIYKTWDQAPERMKGNFMAKMSRSLQRHDQHQPPQGHGGMNGGLDGGVRETTDEAEMRSPDIELGFRQRWRALGHGHSLLHKSNFEAGLDGTSHYAIANQMINYQSVDFGDRFLCVGANWMHLLPRRSDDHNNGHSHQNETQRRLWTWLIICDDHTVISIHEDTGPIGNPEITSSIRGNTLSVLRQLSQSNKSRKDDPISMQSVRDILNFYSNEADIGGEGSSILFYYLFDDWTSAYSLIAAYHRRLEDLSRRILGDIHKKLDQTPSIEIIPRLHVLGREMRGMQHLYENYSNIIDRILKASSLDGRRGVSLSMSARQRFERLGDRVRLLVLSELHEYLVEKDALVSTYFNITAQKDSEATARLTRSATLLAKLSVLFLPVSLMTAYFSVQINDLEGVYTAKTYWVAFGVIMSISFVGIFFFSRLLMFVSDTIDEEVKGVSKFVRNKLGRGDGDGE